MKKNYAFQSGLLTPTLLYAFTVIVAGVLPAMFSFASTTLATTPLSFGKTDVVGPGWASFMIHTDGSIVRIKLWATSPQSPNVLGSFFYNEQEEFLGGFDFSVHRAETGATADINVIPGNPIHESITIQAEPEGGFGYTATYNPNGVPSTFKVLIFGAGEQVSWSYDGGENPADVRLLGLETGTSAFVYMSDEFIGAANAGVDVLGSGGRLTLMADLILDVTDTLIGNWLPISSPTTIPSLGVSTNRLTLTTPTGEEECLYAGLLGCSWPRFRGDTAQGPGRYIFHMTGDGVGVAQNSNDVMLYGADARLPVDQTLIVSPIPTSVVSRKAHGAAGDFDIDLPLAGSPGIECRGGGASGDYQVVATFPGAVTLGSAAVTPGPGGTASVSSANVSPDGTQVTVTLTNVTNAQTMMVTLLGVSDGNNTGDVSVPMSVLLGDTTANGSINSSDISQTKSQSGQEVTASNFRQDVTVNGSINSSDISLVKSKSGTAVP